jgi:hypothetical protein
VHAGLPLCRWMAASRCSSLSAVLERNLDSSSAREGLVLGKQAAAHPKCSRRHFCCVIVFPGLSHRSIYVDLHWLVWVDKYECMLNYMHLCWLRLVCIDLDIFKFVTMCCISFSYTDACVSFVLFALMRLQRPIWIHDWFLWCRQASWHGRMGEQAGQFGEAGSHNYNYNLACKLLKFGVAITWTWQSIICLSTGFNDFCSNHPCVFIYIYILYTASFEWFSALPRFFVPANNQPMLFLVHYWCSSLGSKSFRS